MIFSIFIFRYIALNCVYFFFFLEKKSIAFYLLENKFIWCAALLVMAFWLLTNNKLSWFFIWKNTKVSLLFIIVLGNSPCFVSCQDQWPNIIWNYVCVDSFKKGLLICFHSYCFFQHSTWSSETKTDGNCKKMASLYVFTLFK